jgi:uncharacterized protein
MPAATKALIEAFLGHNQLGLAGYSRDSKKFGHVVYKTLKEKGYTIYPINPEGGNAPGGETIYANVSLLPLEVQALLIVTNPNVTPTVLMDARHRKFESIWIQQMSGQKELYRQLDAEGENVIYNQCILMHANPSGFHKFHRWLTQVFGRLPK